MNHAPAVVTLSVGICKEVGEEKQYGSVPLHLPPGLLPTRENLRDIIVDWAATKIPEGFRLMTKREYWEFWCISSTGKIDPFPFETEDFEA